MHGTQRWDSCCSNLRTNTELLLMPHKNLNPD